MLPNKAAKSLLQLIIFYIGFVSFTILTYFLFSFNFQAAVRSSRRKKSQYVVSLRQEVQDLKQKKREAEEANQLLKQLKSLWEQTLREVEAEFLEGVKKQSAGLINLDTADLINGSDAIGAATNVVGPTNSRKRDSSSSSCVGSIVAGKSKSRRIAAQQSKSVAFQA